jgi:hypothetical protein
MKKTTYLKMTLFCSQTLTVVMMLLGLYIQHDWLHRHVEYVNQSDSVRTNFRDMFLEAQKSVDEKRQTMLVEKFVEVRQKADHYVLDGMKHFQQACQTLYLGVIIVNILGMLVLLREYKNTKAPDVNG